MKLRLLCVGKPRRREAVDWHDLYARRLRRLGLSYAADWVDEERAGGRYSDEHVRQREARRLERELSDAGTVVALDRRGRMPTSEELAQLVERWATPRGTLLIGGPLGLDPALVHRADAVWALSRLTLPHELARVVVAEQLYRAMTIRRGMPYHK